MTYFANLAHAEGQPERALALLGLARKHPAWDSENRRETDAMLAAWKLDAAVVTAGMAQGAELDWDTTMQALLQE